MPQGESMFGYVVEKKVIEMHDNGAYSIDYINPEDDPRGAVADN